MGEMILEIKHLSKSFGSHEVLKDIDFTVSKGDVISVIGASGSGKSTLLRCINLLETPTSGEILYHEKNDCNDLLFNINLQFMSRGSSGLSELPRCPLCPWSLPSPQAGTIHIYSFLSLIILPSPSHSSPRITS